MSVLPLWTRTRSLERTRAGHVSCQCGRAGQPASLSSVLSAYECFDPTTSTKSVGLVKHSRLVVSIPQPDCLSSAVAFCQQVPNQRARDICLVAVVSHPFTCSAYLRVGSVVLQQDSWPQD